MPTVTSIPDTFASFDEHWSPRLVAQLNNHDIKIAKIDGGFIWHAHPDTDELFYLFSGQLTMEMEANADSSSDGFKLENCNLDTGEALKFYKVELKVGDMFVVPQGVRHRPVASNAYIMMIEKMGTVNTGDVESDRKIQVVDVRE